MFLEAGGRLCYVFQAAPRRDTCAFTLFHIRTLVSGLQHLAGFRYRARALLLTCFLTGYLTTSLFPRRHLVPRSHLSRLTRYLSHHGVGRQGD